MSLTLRTSHGCYTLTKNLLLRYDIDVKAKKYISNIYYLPKTQYYWKNLEKVSHSSMKELKDYIKEAYRTRIKYYNLIRKM